MDAHGNKILIKVAAFWSIFKVVEKFICLEFIGSDCSGEAFKWNTDQVSFIKSAGCNVLDKLHKVSSCDNIT